MYFSLYLFNKSYNQSGENNELGLSKLDTETRSFAFSYLKKAAAKGHKKAIEELKKYDSKGNLK